MVLRNNSRALSQEYDLDTSEGIVIIKIDRGGVAYRHSLKNGDVIIGVNRTKVDSIKQFRDIIAKKSGATVLLLFNRNGNEFLIRFSIP